MCAPASCWVRDVHEEGIEPHPGPSALSKNVDGLSERFGDAMYRISQRHKQKPILVLFLQEHHLTQAKAGELRVHTVARTAGLLYVQAHRPVGEVKGGTAIVIPLDMIERKEGESVAAAERRVFDSAYRSPDGRLCSITTLINGTPVTMSSIYAPVASADRPDFFKAIKPRISSPHLIGMDANCVFDPSIDVSRPGPPSADDTKGSAELRALLTDADLTDIARETLGDAPSYTHTTILQGGVNTTRKRLDQIHTPTLDATIWKFLPRTADILPYQRFGHDMVEAELTIVKEARGRDLPFIDEGIFSNLAFNADVLAAINKAMAQATDGTWGTSWEEAKVEVRDMCLARTKEVRLAKDEEAKKLRGIIDLTKSFAQSSSGPASASLVAQIRDLEEELRKHHQKNRSLHDMLETEAYSNGQKHDVSSADFYRQWTPRNSAQWVTELIRRDWTDPSQPQPTPGGRATETRHDHIAEAFTEYYRPLFAEKPPSRSDVALDGTPIDPFKMAADTLRTGNRVLPPTAEKCGLAITEEEVAHTLAYLPLGKSPGPDRLPNQFYRVFASTLAPVLANVYNESKEAGHLPESLRQGIISVLYKKKDRDDPRNYRPITLLNNDYKILMRILTVRMNEAVVQFVSRDQNGFIPDGFIAENVMRLQLVQDMIEEEDLEALFVFLDMEKAFDRCSWEFLLEGLEAVGFDASFIDYIKLAYAPHTPGQPDRRPSRQMYVNGFLGPSFTLGSGVAQGCPISPLLFLIIAEPLTRLINANPNICGIVTQNIDADGPPRHHKISLFADDSTLMMLLRDVPYTLKDIAIWCGATSMRENATKREILLLGSLRGHPERLPNELTLGNQPAKEGESIRALGVPIGNDFDLFHWWLKRYEVVKTRTAHWNGLSRLSITGRNMLLQSILYGSMRYWFFTLIVPQEIVDMLESDAKELLWASSPELHGDSHGTANASNRYIFREASLLPQKQGGGGIMHLPSHIKAFQAQWIIKYLDPRDSPWKDALDHWFVNTEHLGRGAILARRGHRYRRRIPERCTYMHACFDAFQELDLQQNTDATSALTQGESLWKNHRLDIPLSTDSIEEWVVELDTYRLSDVCSIHGKRISHQELLDRVNQCNPSADVTDYAAWRDERIAEIHIIRMNIPSDVRREILEAEVPEIQAGAILKVRLHNGYRTHVLASLDDNDADQFEELFLDTCRFTHRTGNLIDRDDIDTLCHVAVWRAPNKHYMELYAGDVDPAEVEEYRVAVMGAYYECFPLNEGWYAEGQTPCNDKGEPRCMSDLTIHEMTVIFTNRITEGLHPNCEHNWEYRKDGSLRFGRPFRFKWSDVWGSLGTPLSDPTEEKSWRRLLHRATDAKNRHPRDPDQACRLRCGCNDESMDHMVRCMQCKPFWRACIAFCQTVLGETAGMHDIPMVVIFGVGRDGKLLGMLTRAFLRHAVRWWYDSMCSVYKEKTAFVWKSCLHMTLLKFREAVVRKCASIRRHYIHRVYTPLTEVVPEEERTRYATLAKIQLDGSYTLTAAFRLAITQAEA